MVNVGIRLVQRARRPFDLLTLPTQITEHGCAELLGLQGETVGTCVALLRGKEARVLCAGRKIGFEVRGNGVREELCSGVYGVETCDFAAQQQQLVAKIVGVLRGLYLWR